MPQERDPFPSPRYENDYTYTGYKTIQKLPYDKPTHLAQNDDPWRRLHDTTTQASSHRNVFHYDSAAPKDSLDIHLKSTYDQHLGSFQDKNQTVIQRDTVALDHATLKNKESEDSVRETDNKGTKVWVDTQKASIYSIKGSIESHHTASTNRGYSPSITEYKQSNTVSELYSPDTSRTMLDLNTTKKQSAVCVERPGFRHHKKELYVCHPPASQQSTDSGDEFIQLKKVNGSPGECPSRQNLHKELLLSHKRGLLLEEKPELQRVLQQRRLDLHREQELALRPPSDLEQELRKRQQKLQEYEMEEQRRLEDEKNIPEFVRVKENLRRIQLTEQN